MNRNERDKPGMNRRRFLRNTPLALGVLANLGGLPSIASGQGTVSPSLPLSSAGASPASPTRGPRTPRIVVLDWGLTETLVAMGITPVGVAEVAAYQAAVVTPQLPAGVPDVGLRLAPSLEWLAALSPDLILINSSQMSQRDLLSRIAPVHAFAVYTDAGAPYRRAEEVTRALGDLCQQPQAAEALIARTHATLTECKTRLKAFARERNRVARAMYVVQFFDARHLGLYGVRSLFNDVMTTLNVPNAWQGATDYWGIGVGGLDALRTAPDAGLLYFEPLPDAARQMMHDNRLWHALPAANAGRVAPLAPFWGFGMLPSAARFASVLTERLLGDANVGWRPV